MRMNMILRSAAVATAMIAAVGVASAPAHAQSQTHKDPRGDVETLAATRAAKAGIDVTSLRNAYEGKTLTMSMTTPKLIKKGYLAEWLIVTPDSSYVLVLDHTMKKPAVQFQELGGGPRLPLTPARRGTTCDGAKAKAKGATVVGSVPRSCLGGANQVRVGGATIQILQSGDVKADDSRHKGIDGGGSIKLGPALERN